MDKEQLRMQMLASVITEGEYKAKLEENNTTEDKDSLNENFVGMSAINSPFAKREKESYEDAFEHFLSEIYETKFENREQDLEEDEEEDEEEDTRIDYSMGKTGSNQMPKPPKSLNIDINEEEEEDEFTIAMNVQAVINDLLNMEGGQEALKLLEQIDEWNELVDMATNM